MRGRNQKAGQSNNTPMNCNRPVLTNPQLDPFSKIPKYKSCAAKVEPITVSAAPG